jgi:AcrR family transcriptional regulator
MAAARTARLNSVSEQGLRERKKEQTRRAIADAARRLFAARGFEAVTVAEVAREADVSEGTVFNYFPAKEDLFYSGLESFEAALVEAVRDRPAGESALATFRRFVLDQSHGLLERAEVIAEAARLIAASPALQARERELVERYTGALAGVLAEQSRARPGDIEPRVAATMLMGAQRVLVEYVRATVLAGVRGPKLERSVRSQGKRVFALVERGLGDYGVK